MPKTTSVEGGVEQRPTLPLKIASPATDILFMASVEELNPDTVTADLITTEETSWVASVPMVRVPLTVIAPTSTDEGAGEGDGDGEGEGEGEG